MTLKTRNRYFVVSLISVFVMAVTILFGGGKISLSPLLVRGSSSEPINGSITWTKDSSKTKLPNQFSRKYAYYSKTGSGTGIYLYTYGYQTPNNDNIFDSTNSDSDYGIYVVSVMDDPESLFTFQRITAVTITTGVHTSKASQNGIRFYPNGLSGASVTTDIQFDPSKTYRFTTEVANGTQLVIKPKSTYELDITSLTIEYTCTPGGVPTEKTLSSILLSGQTTDFTTGDTFSFDGTVTAHYSDSSSADVTASAVIDSTGVNMSTAGEYSVSVSYTEGGRTKSTSYGITISPPEPSSVTLTGRYNFTSRVRTSGITSWTTNYIEFFSNNKATWHTERHSSMTKIGETNCEVYFVYSALDDGSKITISMTMDGSKSGHANYYGYSFRILETGKTADIEWNSEKAWSGSDYDRPVAGKFTDGEGMPPTSGNDSGVITGDTLKINVYDKNANYDVYDTLTFTLVS